MHKKVFKLISILLLISALFGFNNTASVFGQSNGDGVYQDNSADDNGVSSEEIERLNKEIQNKKSLTQELEKQQQKYSDAIKRAQAEKASLGNQLSILENRLEKARLDIEKTETEIDKTKLEIKKTDIQIERKNTEMETEKGHIANVLRLLHEQDNVGSFEIMLLNNSLADFLSQAKYLEDMNATLGTSLSLLEKLKRELENERASLNEQNADLLKLKENLENNKKSLTANRESKENILLATKQSEKTYQRLLEQARQEQLAAAAEISSMEKEMRERISAMQDGEKQELIYDGFLWPVAKNIITTYFHDPDYPFRYIFEHPAVDIRAAQSSVVKAAASGYVARAKDSGMGYSYIMIVHGDGLSTVYGHISKMYVKGDDFVVQGQTIGLSGGLPGTPGAGKLTTGPHLHFEVRLNGIPVDPLGYLP
ncbi:MAG: peptidoglycan DD-metalloendopeptidase family protein [bacterium]